MNVASVIALIGALTSLLATTAGLVKLIQHTRMPHVHTYRVRYPQAPASTTANIPLPPEAPANGQSVTGTVAPPSA